MKISDKIRTGSEWAIDEAFVIECDNAIFFEEPDKTRCRYGQGKAQIRFNLEEAEALLIDLQDKIAEYKALDTALEEVKEYE